MVGSAGLAAEAARNDAAITKEAAAQVVKTPEILLEPVAKPWPRAREKFQDLVGIDTAMLRIPASWHAVQHHFEKPFPDGSGRWVVTDEGASFVVTPFQRSAASAPVYNEKTKQLSERRLYIKEELFERLLKLSDLALARMLVATRPNFAPGSTAERQRAAVFLQRDLMNQFVWTELRENDR